MNEQERKSFFEKSWWSATTFSPTFPFSLKGLESIRLLSCSHEYAGGVVKRTAPSVWPVSARTWGDLESCLKSEKFHNPKSEELWMASSLISE